MPVFSHLFFRRSFLHAGLLLCAVCCLLLVLLTARTARAASSASDGTPAHLGTATGPLEQGSAPGGGTGNPSGMNGSDQAQQLLQQRLEQLYFEIETSIGKEPVYAAGYLLDLYRKNQFNLLWSNPSAINQLISAIHASADEGLIPDDYHLKALAQYGHDLKEHASLAKQVEYDLLLSDAMILLGHHKRDGKVDPRKVEDKKNLEPATPRSWSVDTYLVAIKNGTVRETLDKLSPRHPSYVNLKEALNRYKQIAGKSVWRQIPAGQSLKPGMVDPRVPAIRQRLAATGEYYAKGGGESSLYDDQLVTAVKAFQARHHIEPDGVAGNSTIKAMNITMAERINQIRVNLERTRWVIHDMPNSSLIVDIAGFMVQYYHDNKMIWKSKVMVGKPFHQTPVFRSAITYIVLNPTWTPTPDIVKNESVPSIVKDPDFLAKQRMRVFDSSGTEIDPHAIPWKQYQGRVLPYTLRQDPGVDNSLGLIKFLFPNPYHVYMHDTPSKSLFGRSQRAFSHGCIRVQNPLELGRLILTNDTGNPTTVEKMDQILATGKTATVILKQPLPVYLMYLTTSVQDGKVMFKPDLYDRDEAVVTALNAPPSPLNLTVQIPEVKGGSPSPNQQVRIDKAVKYVQNEQQNAVAPYAKDSL
jgi:murein L,D-transpeptidase YcbB/YkuD